MGNFFKQCSFYFILNIDATTKIPIDVFLSEIQKNTHNFLSLALENKNTTFASTTLRNTYIQMNANPTVTKRFIKSLTSMVSNLTNNPSTSEETRIRQSVKDYLIVQDAFIASFPGMVNFKIDPEITLNPDNVDFYSTYQQIEGDLQDIIKKPSDCRLYFSNNTVKYTIAKLGVLSVKASQQRQNCKFMTHDSFHVLFSVWSLIFMYFQSFFSSVDKYIRVVFKSDSSEHIHLP